MVSLDELELISKEYQRSRVALISRQEKSWRLVDYLGPESGQFSRPTYVLLRRGIYQNPDDRRPHSTSNSRNTGKVTIMDWIAESGIIQTEWQKNF